MVFGWGLVGKSWTSQYDKDDVLAELTRRFEEGYQLRKSPVAKVREKVYPADDHGGDVAAAHQECADGVIDGGDTSHQWRYRYEEWNLWRNDLGWETKNRKTRKQHFGGASRDVLPTRGVGNRPQTLSRDQEDMCRVESDYADETELSPMGRASTDSHLQRSSGNGDASRDIARRIKKNGRRSKMGGTCTPTNRVAGRKEGSRSASPQIYMFAQIPQGFEGTWMDSNKREDLWVEYGGKVTQWRPPAKYEEWYDWNRPNPEAIATSIANALREYKVAGKILLVGDSTAAYCVSRIAHISATELQRQIRRRVDGVTYVSLRASSLAKYVDFARQIKEAAIGSSEVFDSLVLLGGWNDDAPPNDYIRSMAKLLTEMRPGPFAPYPGTSDVGFV